MAKIQPANENDIASMIRKFGSVPAEFLDLIHEATEFKIQHDKSVMWIPTQRPQLRISWRRLMIVVANPYLKPLP
jgi:hypothetical protein